MKVRQELGEWHGGCETPESGLLCYIDRAKGRNQHYRAPIVALLVYPYPKHALGHDLIHTFLSYS